jgi:Tfp pilus assembly protein PilF
LSPEFVRRGMCCAVMASLLACLTACSSSPKKDDVAARLAVQEQVNENLAAADKAIKQGQPEQAIEQLDKAIKADPAAKAPWLKKAQIHFDARQYGLAITEAQEVLQRDVNDLTAKSILAVSGLRVSADALEQLRKANEVNGPTRSEAESVARLIREALGEPILVPPVAAAASEPGKARPARPAPRPTSAAAAAPRPTPSPNVAATNAPVAAPTPKPAVASGSPSSNRSGAANGGRNNPFGALQ